MTDTPRTDAWLLSIKCGESANALDHARALERELRDRQSDLMHICEVTGAEYAIEGVRRLQAENAALRKALERLKHPQNPLPVSGIKEAGRG